MVPQCCELIGLLNDLLSRGLIYPTLGKGKPASKVPWDVDTLAGCKGVKTFSPESFKGHLFFFGRSDFCLLN